MSKPFSFLHDLHCHSSLSSCCHDKSCTAPALFQQAKEMGYDTLCLADHLWDGDVPGASDWYAPQDIPHVLSADCRDMIPGMRCLQGCETEYCGKGKLGLSREHFDLFDFVVIPPNHFHMKNFVRREEITSPAQVADLFMERLEEIGQLDIPHEKVGIAHITCNLIYREDPPAVFRLLDEKRMRKIFDVFARNGNGIELNAFSFSGWEEHPEILRPYQWAREVGCKFYCASDAHALKDYAAVGQKLPPVIKALGLTENDRYMVPEK